MGYAESAGLSRKQIQKRLRAAARNPETHLRDPLFAPLAEALTHRRGMAFGNRAGNASFKQWGNDLDPKSIEQMERACSLPVSVRGALMPDAHVGYGLPIGGVLATDNAVIPYAVGVDIACRMKLTALDMPPETLDDERSEALRRAIETETRFGIAAAFRQRRSHPVMDRDWGVSPVTRQLKDKAWSQLGTSGSGNHFVEFGTLDIATEGLGIAPGRYLALMSHSGSRGTGAEVCTYYSRQAQAARKGLPKELTHLAWFSLDSHEGREYWAAMELMGHYAAANHELIHRHIAKHLGAEVVLDIENHHNFAWKERHDGRDAIVHRKGATPAAPGQLGIIPGSMA
ncbi:MAG TPA: RtcB family protein, partial [Candidatus Hydrogenedentes bacterium]|nr:RtcB family protein [Candidatus Hydrogenedentota bacterium]